ncbi:MAG: NUDIX hydrolase [Proteocatella sp.]
MTKEKTISSTQIYNGKVVSLKVDVVQINETQTAIREIVTHCGAVCGVGITKEKKIVLVRQYRKSIEKDIIEIPAGKLDLGEEPDDAIIREFKEETGYDVENVTYMTYFYTTPGFSDEIGHLYFLDATEKGDTNFDDDEDIEILEYSLADVKAMIYNKEIVDSKTILGIMMYSDYIEREKQ